MQNSDRKYNQNTLKQKNWQSTHLGFDILNYNVSLLEGKPNAKHEKLTLAIQIIWQSQQLKYTKQFKTSDLPTQAITIFSDVQTLYDYIQENYNDMSRIKFQPNQNILTIVNIIVMKNKQIKQQISLFLDKQRYVPPKKYQLQELVNNEKSFLNQSQISAISTDKILSQSKIIIEQLIKDKNAQLQNKSIILENKSIYLENKNIELQNKVNMMSQHLNNFINEIKTLRNQNKLFSNALNSCNINVSKLQRQNMLLNQRIQKLQKQKATLNDLRQLQAKVQQNKEQSANNFDRPQIHNINQNIQQIKKQVSDQKWYIDQLDTSLVNIRESHIEFQKFKSKCQVHINNQSKNDFVLPLVNQIKKQINILNSKVVEFKQNNSRLGQKIFITLDIKNNKYIDNFRIIQNILQKISADQQRHQILANQPFNLFQLKAKSYFEIKIISTVNHQVVIGIVGESRKGQRYSYDKKQCICYDGQGFIFEQGHKIKMPCQFHNSQTIRVVLDPIQCLIQWFVGYTQVGSAIIPESMRKMRILPYFELYCISDKIAING